MNLNPIREFHLSRRGQGISCDADGAFAGLVPLLKRSADNPKAWEARACDELSEALTEHYGLPVDISARRAGLAMIARALNGGDIALAQIATLHLQLPERPPLEKSASTRDAMIKLVRELYWSGLLKWDPDEHPRYPAGADDSKGGQFAPKGEDDGGPSNPDQTNAGGTNEGMLDGGVYHPGEDPGQIDPTADRSIQVGLNWLQHEAAVQREVDQWKKLGFLVVRNVAFVNPNTGTPIIADYTVSAWLPNPDTLFLTRKPEPILIRDVKTGSGGLTDNQKEVYPYILRGGEVIPVGLRAEEAGFDVGEPVAIRELYVGHDLPSDSVH